MLLNIVAWCIVWYAPSTSLYMLNYLWLLIMMDVGHLCFISYIVS